MSSEDTLKVFESFLEELRQQICEKKVESEEQLERLISTVFIIGIKELETDDINSILNVIFKYIKEHTDKFPSLTLLDYAKRFLELLRERQSNTKQETRFFVSLAWPNDLRTVAQRLFPEEYVIYSFELSALTCEVVGATWLRADPQFSALLASLTNGRLRETMEDGDKTKLDQLVLCLSLLEDVMHCVEDDDSAKEIDDTAAMSISKSSQEAASFMCECVIELEKKFGDSVLEMDILLVVSRFLYAFFNIGGWKIVRLDLLVEALSILIRARDHTKSESAQYTTVFEEVVKELKSQGTSPEAKT